MVGWVLVFIAKLKRTAMNELPALLVVTVRANVKSWKCCVIASIWMVSHKILTTCLLLFVLYIVRFRVYLKKTMWMLLCVCVSASIFFMHTWLTCLRIRICALLGIIVCFCLSLYIYLCTYILIFAFKCMRFFSFLIYLML